MGLLDKLNPVTVLKESKLRYKEAVEEELKKREERLIERIEIEIPKGDGTETLAAISEGDMSLVEPIPQRGVPIILKKNEVCYAKVQDAQFWEDRAVRKTRGGYGGFNFRVAKGASFHVGKFGATGESHMERRHIDTGNVFVTNKRFVFIGSSKSIDFPLNKVLSVEPFSNGVGIARSNKQKTEYFVGFYGLIIKAIIEGALKNL